MEIRELKSDCFEGATSKGWRDTFEFRVSGGAAALTRTITDFFRNRGAFPVDSPAGMRFRRGRALWNYLGVGRELWLAHTIEIEVKPSDDGGSTVTVSYRFAGWSIRFAPYQTEREISELVRNLRGQ
jgi:hypothetical protein